MIRSQQGVVVRIERLSAKCQKFLSLPTQKHATGFAVGRQMTATRVATPGSALLCARSANRAFLFLLESYSILRFQSQLVNSAMILDTLQKIEARIQGASVLKEESRKELLGLLSTMKSEVADLSRTHSEQAQSIAGFAEVSTHEATREDKNPELLQLSLKGLSASATGFETSHPRLVEIVNSICNTLSNLGI